MIKFVKSIALVTLVVSALSLGAKAQTKAHADSSRIVRKEAHQKLKALLTPQQQAALKENHDKQKAAMAGFRASLTADQKAIMKDKALSHKERKSKLAETFTAEQKKTIAANKAARKESRKAFLATLTEAQKAQMKEIFKDRKGHGGFRHHKAQKA
ncbi:hypothetical protein ABDD95_04725 [Mucilaginibacter sp. PAMB04274]|uniref:hypothetical protein n=1 Tax=Mucilaginibacter sp. PAMB04274 TaxID=3138568 RepID=UPI0031F64972